MKKRLTALIVVAMMAILAACGSSSSGEEKKSPEVSSEQPAVEEKTEEPVAEEPAEEKPVPVEAEEAELAEEEIVEYTVDDILDMLNKNPLNASRTLKDKRIFLTGSVGNIDASGNYISLVGSDNFSLDSVMCYIKNDDQLEFVAGIEKGTSVRILGKVKDVGEVMGYSIDIEEIEKYYDYRIIDYKDYHFDYSEYEKLTSAGGSTFWVPKYWSEHKASSWSPEDGVFEYQFKDKTDIYTDYTVTFIPYTIEKMRERGYSIEGDQAFDTLIDLWGDEQFGVYKELLSSIAAEVGEEVTSVETGFAYINKFPALDIYAKLESGCVVCDMLIMPNEIVVFSNVYNGFESLHADESFRVILSINQNLVTYDPNADTGVNIEKELKEAVEAVEEESSNEQAPTSSSAGADYEVIYNEYSQKIRAATPGLIEEYKQKAAGNDNGVTGLATISNEQVEKLAEIVNEGVQEMAEVMLYKGSGKYDEYEEWAAKLYDVYEEESGKIMDEYIGSY